MKATLRNMPREGGEPTTPEAATEKMTGSWPHVVVHVYEQNAKGHFTHRSTGSYVKDTWFADLVRHASGFGHRGKLRIDLCPGGDDENLSRRLSYDLLLERDLADIVADMQRRLEALERGAIVPQAIFSRFSSTGLMPPMPRFLEERHPIPEWPSDRRHVGWYDDRGKFRALDPDLVDTLLSGDGHHVRITHAESRQHMSTHIGGYGVSLLGKLHDRISEWGRGSGPYRIAVIGRLFSMRGFEQDEAFVFWLDGILGRS